MSLKVKEGQKAPKVMLQNQDGKTLCLKDLSAKVILYFYPRDMTPGCTMEACAFNENWHRLKKRNVVVLGVSFDDAKQHQKFRAKHDLQFDLLVDEGKKLAKAFGVYQKKKFMGREFMGIVRSTFLIDEKGVIQKIWSPVRVSGHVDEVLQAL